MNKLKSSFGNILMSLTGICLVAGLALSATNRFTAEAIAASNAATLRNAIKSVTPEFDNNPSDERYLIATPEGDSLTVYPARKGEVYAGCAVESRSKKGFSGLIRVMVGFDKDNKVFAYSVLEHSETPGLGSKMQEWFSVARNRQSVIGRDMKEGLLKVVKDGGDVDAITAATISSRAFLDAINTAFTAFTNTNDASTGATKQ
ncbi:MAG: RnfABCDGE type electron transport complex subunit G [Tannerella sp.]|jgi:electron transport complex protein RnfG|nr:RnfABCDGE type electron transport complex subunit G [Tannerella sp.]